MIRREEQKIRNAAAELEVLERFDRRRARLGHDYGNGQRGAELGRRRRELRPHGDVFEVSPWDLLTAYDRLGRPRLERIRREDYRRSTPATSRTVRAWEELLAELELRRDGAVKVCAL